MEQKRSGVLPRPIIVVGLTLLLVCVYKGTLAPNCPTAVPAPHHAVQHGAAQSAGQRADALAPPPPPAWHGVRDCPVYILDLSAEVAPQIGIPQCDITDPEVWPLDQPGELPWSLQRMERMHHSHYQYAGQWWLTQALRNASGLLTDNIDEACMVWVDSYCYNQWFIIQRAIQLRGLTQYPTSGVDLRKAFRAALDHVTESQRFKRRQGRDFAFWLPMQDLKPGAPFKNLCSDLLLSHTLVAEHSETCRAKRAKVHLRETQVLPYNTVAGVDLSQRVVGSSRPTLLYMQASCAKNTKTNCGKLMRYQAAAAFNHSGPDVQVRCANIPKENSRSYSEVQAEMRASRFCLLPPGDTSSSNRLTEVTLAGCIPVFLGDPWHEMPFGNGEVDYASFAVFLNVTDSPWRGTPACATPLRTWPQTADVRFATVAVPDLPAVLEFLRRMSPQALERRQAALEQERPKFFYGVAPGGASSALADIVFTNLLSYGQRLAVGEFTE